MWDRRAFTGQPLEDNRLTDYRKRVKLENSVGSLKVFCGLLGLGVLCVLSLLAILSGTEGGLFAGGMLAVVTCFGKFAFYGVCLWGLFGPWRNYSDQNGKECSRRKEMLARIEQTRIGGVNAMRRNCNARLNKKS